MTQCTHESPSLEPGVCLRLCISGGERLPLACTAFYTNAEMALLDGDG